ncbi:maleylpyruvate isomerase family mycothiol-dependent enzyme [Amycolatopsis sp. CA-128772]|uniref:maleylpyruvate isomerase family mycothiol-dependent enzyme n=1 Tax=Amycolatopsis sp. CA-128772 TaxID=2073159 RepID=UPI000CCFF328|nr:maleylpyruvate isomerase family mycothiol-dependent enzyme [Amycolatopsis sp. CA-128772]
MPARPADEEVLAAALDHAVAAAAEADPGRPSGCAGWTVAGVLAHLTQSLRCVADALVSGTVPVPAARTSGRDLGRAAVALAAAARDLRGRRAVAVDGLALPCRQLIVVGALEAAVHGWDAVPSRPIPGDLAARLLAELPSVLTRREGLFAEPVVLPAGRPAGERLLAALGRDPSVRDFRP